jgi:hypothetical protein
MYPGRRREDHDDAVSSRSALTLRWADGNPATTSLIATTTRLRRPRPGTQIPHTRRLDLPGGDQVQVAFYREPLRLPGRYLWIASRSHLDVGDFHEWIYRRRHRAEEQWTRHARTRSGGLIRLRGDRLCPSGRMMTVRSWSRRARPGPRNLMTTTSPPGGVRRERSPGPCISGHKHEANPTHQQRSPGPRLSDSGSISCVDK